MTSIGRGFEQFFLAVVCIDRWDVEEAQDSLTALTRMDIKQNNTNT